MNVSPCPGWEPRLEARLFGELATPEREAVTDHLAECASCREAYYDAEAAFHALADVADPPLPYGESFARERADRAWADFQSRARSPLLLVAAAALLAIGVGIGRFSRAPSESVDEQAITAEAMESLERAEFLSDVGMRYLDGLRDVLDPPLGGGDPILAREQARTLIRDGRFLTRHLDAQHDRDFLRAIRRAQLFLEEIAALEDSTSRESIRVLEASLRESRLRQEMLSLDISRDVEHALRAAGPATGKDF